MADSLVIVVADVDVLAVEYISDLLERHGFSVRIAPPVHSAVGNWIRRYGAALCLIDSTLRDGDSIEEIGALHRDHPLTRIIVRTADTSPNTMREVLDAGASGYVHKSRGPIALVEAIRRVVDGEVVVEGTFTRTQPPEAKPDAEVLQLVNQLTPRQYECLEMLAEGKGTLAIAEQLGISVLTVRSHVQAVLGKLGVRSRLEAASLMARHQGSQPPRESRQLTSADGAGVSPGL